MRRTRIPLGVQKEFEMISEDGVKINTRGQYAVMAMVELANAGKDKPLPLSEIAENAGISLSYLEQLIAGMRRHDLVKSYRGPGGGYTLAKEPHDIIIAEILHAAEDSTPAKRHVLSGDRLRCKYTRALMGHIENILEVTLTKITLEDVLNKRLDEHPETSKVFEVLSESA